MEACSEEDRLPPMRAAWEQQFSAGHDLVDTQHLGLLTHCNLLADLCEHADAEAGAQAFDQSYEQLKALARQHFEAEAALLESRGFPDLEDHADECGEFDYLAGEIATAENFDRVELQRFVTLWCVGHITSSARQLSALPARGDTSA